MCEPDRVAEGAELPPGWRNLEGDEFAPQRKIRIDAVDDRGLRQAVGQARFDQSCLIAGDEDAR